MNDVSTLTGHCYCGAVSFEVSGAPVKVAHCHCESCRRSLGAPMVTSAGYHVDNVQFTGELPSYFNTDSGVSRGFCGHCGSSFSYSRKENNYIFIYVGLFDKPEELTPEVHMMYSEKIQWMQIDDHLPKSDEFV